MPFAIDVLMTNSGLQYQNVLHNLYFKQEKLQFSITIKKNEIKAKSTAKLSIDKVHITLKYGRG